MIRGYEFISFTPVVSEIIETQIGTAQADAFDLPIKGSPQRFTYLIKGELDARGATVDRQNVWIRGFHG